MADVKSMLNKFEQVDNMSAGKGNKPTVAAKPVLQRFQQAAKENDSGTTATSSLPVKPIFKPGHPPPVKLAGLTGPMPALKPTIANSSSNNTGEKGGRVNVPKAFQNGRATEDVSNDNNNNSDQTAIKKDLWPKPKPPATTTTSSSSDDDKLSTVPKFPSMSISNQTLTNNSQKQTVSSSKSDNDKNLENSKPKVPILPKKPPNKTDSIRSNSSNSSYSSTSSSNSSSNETTNITSPISPPAKSPLSSSQSPTSGVFDFKSMLRKVDSSSSGPPVKRVLSNISNESSSTETPASKAPVSTSSSVASTSSSSSNIDKPNAQSRVPPIPSTDSVQMRSNRNKDEEDIVIRKSDGKRFRRMPLPSHKPPTTPNKPVVPRNIDLTPIRQQYQKLKKGSDVIDDVPETDEGDDIYWEGETPNIASLPRIPAKPVAETKHQSQRISLIPEMSAEEEEEGDQPVYDDTPIEEDIYDDAMSERPNEAKPKTSVSSEPQSPTETEQDKKRRLKEEANAKKKEEKERREKEKKEREEEKRKKKKEEEEARLRNKFNLTGEEKMVGEGVIKQDAKASGLNLKVKKGQIVTIVRLDSNPPNKWLVKMDTQLGYVDSQNIEVDPNIIRQETEAMQGLTEEEDLDQPTYDDVPVENSPSFIVPLHQDDEEEDGEEIYDMCE